MTLEFKSRVEKFSPSMHLSEALLSLVLRHNAFISEPGVTLIVPVKSSIVFPTRGEIVKVFIVAEKTVVNKKIMLKITKILFIKFTFL